MKKLYSLMACAAIAMAINTHAMDPERHSFFTLIDQFIGNNMLGTTSNWRAIFGILQKLVIEGNVFTVNDYFSKQGLTLLCQAVYDNDLLAAKILLETYNANPNGKSASSGMTPLMFACMKGYADIAMLLLQHGANPLIQNKKGNNSFFFAQTYAKHNFYKDDTVLRILQTYKP
jgi:hypothetical protein